jgi:hypothetical protein
VSDPGNNSLPPGGTIGSFGAGFNSTSPAGTEVAPQAAVNTPSQVDPLEDLDHHELAPMAEGSGGMDSSHKDVVGPVGATILTPAPFRDDGTEAVGGTVVDQGESEPSPQGLADCSAFDLTALQGALQQVLGQIQNLGHDMGGWLTGWATMGIYPWVVAVVVASLAYELNRRRTRSARPGLELALSSEGAPLPWGPGWAGLSPVEKP